MNRLQNNTLVRAGAPRKSPVSCASGIAARPAVHHADISQHRLPALPGSLPGHGTGRAMVPFGTERCAVVFAAVQPHPEPSSMSVDLIAQRPNIGTPSSPPVTGSTNSVPNVPGLIRSGLNLFQLYQMNNDYQNALQQAQQQLANAPEGSAVVIEQAFSTGGSREFKVSTYNGTGLTSTFNSAEAANNYVNSDKLYPNDGFRHSTSYTIVWKGADNVSPVLSSPPNTQIFSTGELQNR
jgi:hypothetical protein